MTQAAFHCSHCGQTLMRDAARTWIKSWCERSQRYTRLFKISPSAAYCGVGLIGGWCKRPKGHKGRHACS